MFYLGYSVSYAKLNKFPIEFYTKADLYHAWLQWIHVIKMFVMRSEILQSLGVSVQLNRNTELQLQLYFLHSVEVVQVLVIEIS